MVKIERSPIAPQSLKKEAEKVNGSYLKDDVVEQLTKDFHGKCYICELKDLQDPQVEHLLPHENGKWKDRKFDWENLFLSCSHCNSVKNQKKYAEGILDCCKKDPEQYIIFFLKENDVYVKEKNEKDKQAVLTAQLVDEVFNLKNTGMRKIKSDIRIKELQIEMNILYKKLQEYKQNPTSRLIIRTIKALLKRETAFAGFKRCYVREHLEEYPVFAEDIYI